MVLSGCVRSTMGSAVMGNNSFDFAQDLRFASACANCSKRIIRISYLVFSIPPGKISHNEISGKKNLKLSCTSTSDKVNYKYSLQTSG